MSEHTRIKLKRTYTRPKYRNSRHSKKPYKRGGQKGDPWTDSYAEIPVSHIIRYLQVNVGKPYDKVYSELVHKMRKSHIPVYKLNTILKSLMGKKGERTYWKPTFYLSNGILSINKVTHFPSLEEQLRKYQV